MSRLLVVPAPRAGSIEDAAKRKLLCSEALDWCALTTGGAELVVKTKAGAVAVEFVAEPASKPTPKAKKPASGKKKPARKPRA